jgi:hypothetical protein
MESDGGSTGCAYPPLIWSQGAGLVRIFRFVCSVMLVSVNRIFATPPATSVLAEDVARMQVAIDQATEGFAEGGIPIGAALVSAHTAVLTSADHSGYASKFAKDGKLLGVGRNQRIQAGSATRHGEVSFYYYLVIVTDGCTLKIDCLENIGVSPMSNSAHANFSPLAEAYCVGLQRLHVGKTNISKVEIQTSFVECIRHSPRALCALEQVSVLSNSSTDSEI